MKTVTTILFSANVYGEDHYHLYLNGKEYIAIMPIGKKPAKADLIEIF